MGHPESLVCFLETRGLSRKTHPLMLGFSRCFWKVHLSLVSEKGMDSTFPIWYFCLAPVHPLLAWEVGLDSQLTFHVSATGCLCLQFASIGSRWLVLLLGGIGGLSISECFIVTPTNCSLCSPLPMSPGRQYCLHRQLTGPVLEGSGGALSRCPRACAASLPR